MFYSVHKNECLSWFWVRKVGEGHMLIPLTKRSSCKHRCNMAVWSEMAFSSSSCIKIPKQNSRLYYLVQTINQVCPKCSHIHVATQARINLFKTFFILNVTYILYNSREKPEDKLKLCWKDSSSDNNYSKSDLPEKCSASQNLQEKCHDLTVSIWQLSASPKGTPYLRWNMVVAASGCGIRVLLKQIKL